LASGLGVLLFCACFSGPSREQMTESDKANFARNLAQAQAGNAAAARFVWATYAHGNLAVQKNEVEALKWLHAAADLGDSFSRLELAHDYRNGGLGVARDFGEALRRLQEMCVPATPRGHDFTLERACVELGDIYLSGAEVPKDTAKALSLYEMGATHRSGAAGMRLANLYDQGVAVARDYVVSCKWSLIARAPKPALDDCQRLLPPDEYRRAEDAAAAWNQSH
jgi:TPR repeat protein